MTRAMLLLSLLGGCALALACADETTPSSDSGSDTQGAGPSLGGRVQDTAGVPVEGAKVEAGGKMAYSDAEGKYLLGGLSPGAATVSVTQDWFKPTTQSVTIAPSGPTTLHLTLEEHPLQILPADRALAETHNQTFDWTTDTVSIVILPRPSRQALDNAVYWRNPALHRDTSQIQPVTPAPQPEIGSGPQGFTFPTQQSQEALDNTTIVDTLAETPLTEAERNDPLMWRPVLNWLLGRDAAQAAGLNVAGAAVLQQAWGSNAVQPQQLERVFLHGSEIYVEVAFEPFLQLGAGITDSDGDGRKEIFARLAPAHYSAAIVSQLRTEYMQPTYNTHGMSQEINSSLNELYSKTAAQVERFIGQPFEVAGLGTIAYPFVVLKHSGGALNVLLVGP